MQETELQSEGILRAHQRALDAMERGAPLAEVLERFTTEAEAIHPGLRCSVLLVENGHLRHGAAPSLPDEYNEAVDNLLVAPGIGSCGAAAFSRKRVVIRDVRTHPNWKDFQALVEMADIGASWSEPILSSGEVVGTFAMYYREPREPQEFELEFIRTMAQIAGVAIRSAQLERAHEVNEQKLRQILDLDPNMLFVKDWEGRFLLANEAVAQAYGVGVKDLERLSHGDLHGDPVELAKMLSDDRAVMLSGQPRFIPEETFIDVDGRQRVLQTTKIPYAFAGQGVRAVLGVAVDVTERKRVEEWLRQSEERFRQLAEAIREVFWLTDWESNEVLYVSPAYEAIWGRPCRTLYEDSRSWAQSIHPDDIDRVVTAFRTDAQRGQYDVEYRIVRHDGEERWIHDRAFPINDADGRTFRIAGLSEDVTLRKTTELELERALHELEARSSARLRSLESDLLWAEERERRRLSVDLHDGLNQILTLCQIKLGALGGALEEDRREDAQALAGEIGGLVDQANRSARSLTFQLSPPILFDIGFEAALGWLCEDVQQSYDIKVELSGDCDPPDPPGLIEERIRVLLFRAVRELLINVAKHAGADRARISLQRSPGDIVVRVSDDGVAFEPAKVGRRGLGLSSIRERLESFGGRMEIDSAPGRGTAITLRSPLSVPENQSLEELE